MHHETTGCQLDKIRECATGVDANTGVHDTDSMGSKGPKVQASKGRGVPKSRGPPAEALAKAGPAGGSTWAGQRSGQAEPVPVRGEIAPPTRQYREVRVPTSPGSAASVVGALNAAGADGWETTGLSFSSPGATIVVMKRQVKGGR